MADKSALGVAVWAVVVTEALEQKLGKCWLNEPLFRTQALKFPVPSGFLCVLHVLTKAENQIEGTPPLSCLSRGCAL